MRVLPAGRAPRTSAGRRSPKPRRHTTCISSNSTTRAGPYPEPPAGTNPGHKDASARQLRLVVERLHEVAAKQRIRIFVFVHGWKHNAAFDDDNVIHFRDFLKESAQYELAAQSDARVVGVYVGWPGKSLGLGEPAISATFLDRKIAAQQRVRIHLIGHSFGGLALYAAVSQSLVFSFITGEDIDSKRAPVERLGDMIVLINPAFEATRYQPLDRVARNREYAVYQSPVFVAVTSKADVATAVAFPQGRTVNTLLEREITRDEGQANRNTPGHVTPTSPTAWRLRMRRRAQWVLEPASAAKAKLQLPR